MEGPGPFAQGRRGRHGTSDAASKTHAGSRSTSRSRRPCFARSTRCSSRSKSSARRGCPSFEDQALNERDYGNLSGLNKDEARKQWGEEQVQIWRRSYDVNPPGGESLKDTVARVLPYYCQNILPEVLGGKRVLVAAHGNSLRALVMVLDKLTPKTIPGVDLETGVQLVYRLKADSTVASKVVLTG